MGNPGTHPLYKRTVKSMVSAGKDLSLRTKASIYFEGSKKTQMFEVV